MHVLDQPASLLADGYLAAPIVEHPRIIVPGLGIVLVGSDPEIAFRRPGFVFFQHPLHLERRSLAEVAGHRASRDRIVLIYGGESAIAAALRDLALNAHREK